MAQYKINIGDKVPYFELLDQNGNPFSSDVLYGAPSILYFYPKDDTPGCTKEACSFRDSMERFNDLQIKVVGISPDDSQSHKKFIERYQLNFTLLSDPTHEVAILYDAWQEKNIFGKKSMGMERATFLIDSNGIIKWIERPVQVDGHIERVISAARKFTSLDFQE